MILPNRTVPFLFILGFMCFIAPAFGATLLTDTELDELGAGGESPMQKAEDSVTDPLSDQGLTYITGRGGSSFIWPFQYAPLKLPSTKRITWSGGGLKGGLNIDLGPALQFRGTPQPPSQGGAGSTNAVP